MNREYEPLDLAPFCDTGIEAFAGLAPSTGPTVAFWHPVGYVNSPPVGPQLFHGLPFSIGGPPDRAFIGLPRTSPAVVPVGKAVRGLIFAHVLLESAIMQSGPLGETAAEYVVRYASGAEMVLPIRDRFEIAAIPAIFGIQPFRALPCREEWLAPREGGNWNVMGHRQKEALSGLAFSHYFLWPWSNPRPDDPIAVIEVRGTGGQRMVLAGITLRHIDEEPFYREGRRPVVVEFKDKARADAPFSTEIAVDRGIATYTHALPRDTGPAYLDNYFAGWGETQNTKSSPAYSEVTATRSATLEVRQGNEVVERVKWADLDASGKVETDRVRVEIAENGRNWVHVTVVDDATGKPVPCRVHFRSPAGVPYQPNGHHDHLHSNLDTWHVDIGGDLRLGQTTYAYIDGTCQGWLPRGEVIVDVARGFEYQPLRTKISIGPEQRELTLRLKRWTDMNARGWYSGDTHVHFLGAAGAHTEAQGEDLNVVNLLASQWGHLFTNTEDFIGRPTTSPDGRSIVYVAQENRQHILGHISLLGLKKPVLPFGAGNPNEGFMGGTLDVTMSDWADRTHAQGGTVVLPHFPMPNGEVSALVATGRGDAIEMLHHRAFEHAEYYRYLNAGYRLPLVGGTDKMSGDVPVGLYRTYARILEGEGFDYDAWCAAVKAGRTFLSSGPMLDFTVEGRQIGDTMALPGNGGTVEVHCLAESIFPVHTLELVHNGGVVARETSKDGSRVLELKAKVGVTAHSWLAARCSGPDYVAPKHHDVWRRGMFAHTSPIYVAVGGPWHMSNAETIHYMMTLIDGSLQFLRERAVQYPPSDVTHHHHHRSHQEYLESPFREAQDVLHRRMHDLGIPH